MAFEQEEAQEKAREYLNYCVKKHGRGWMNGIAEYFILASTEISRALAGGDMLGGFAWAEAEISFCKFLLEHATRKALKDGDGESMRILQEAWRAFVKDIRGLVEGNGGE